MKLKDKINIKGIIQQEFKAAKVKVTPELIELIITKILDYIIANVGKKAKKIKALEARVKELEAQLGIAK